MAMASWNSSLGLYQKTTSFQISCRKRDRDRDRERSSIHPYKVVEITPPPKCLGVRCLPPVSPQPLPNSQLFHFRLSLFPS
ncbi:hypothetical protein PIB30_077881 [Stylosanthes scabra]|uniref:Uncharacterized protein n=1 Tax=Stylosanthes scabra TaxID=79078 RepID=A0ABU6VSQ5_9FABA|nr:hypothetical protein [Stylosanthes scabra]